MGRPLNKKYFGNRNIGTNGNQTTQHSGNISDGVTDGDDHIGGEGIAGIVVTLGGNYINRLPTFTNFPDPLIANGVRCQSVLHSVAESASVWNGTRGTGYQVGDVVTDRNGSTWRVTELEVATFTLDPSNRGTAYGGDDTIPYNYGIYINLDGVNGSGVPNGNYDISRSSRGSYTTPGVPPATTGAQTPSGLGGHGAQWLLTWGIKTLQYVSTIDYAYGTSYYFAGDNTVTGGHGTGAKLNVGFAIDHISISQKGSGYSDEQLSDLAFSTADNPGEVRATGTLVLTTDSGAVGSATNQENAIVAFAYVDGLEEVDIAKQVSTDRYLINSNATGNRDKPFFTGRLKTTGIASGGISQHGTTYETEMNIWAFDQDGGSYLVKKLTEKKAVVVPFACARLSKSAGTRFPLNDNGSPRQVPWKFFEGQANASAGYVKIENA